MQFLKANTAADVLIGPFVEDGDGDSPLTALTLDVELSKNGQALADSESAAPTHDAAGTVDGYYNCILGTTDTNTEGTLTLVVHHADALPIRHDYMVLAEAAYDSMFAAKDTGLMSVNVDTIKTQAVTCAAGVTVRADVGAAAAPGAANGMFIGGTNAATTVASLSCTGQLDAGNVVVDAGMDVVGALSANSLLIDTTTTLTGAVALSSTLAIAGASTLASASITGQLDMGNLLVDSTVAVGTTTTLTGNVELSGNLAVVGTTTLTDAVSLGSTLGITGASTLASLSVTGQLDAGSVLVDTTTTLTGAVELSATLAIVGVQTHTGAITYAGGLVSDITGNLSGSVGTCAAATVSAIGNDVITPASVDEDADFIIQALSITNALDAGSVLVDGTTTLTGNVELSGTLAVVGVQTHTGAITHTGGLVSNITGNLSGSIGTNTELGPAEVNAEVLDVLNVDTFAEPGDEVPTSTTSLVDKIGYLYKFLRNKLDTTATKIHVYNDAGDNIDQTSTISDDGTDFIRGEFGAGE